MTRGRSPDELLSGAEDAPGCRPGRLFSGVLLVCAGLVVTTCVAMGLGGVSVEIKYVGTGRPVTVVLMRVSESDPSHVYSTFPSREMRPGETTEFDEDLGGDAVLKVRVTRSSGAMYEVVIHEYLGTLTRQHVELEVGATALLRARQWHGYFRGVQDVDIREP